MTVRHIRDGIELEPIVKDENFDFQYQQAVTLSRKIILPVEIVFFAEIAEFVTFQGDELILECEYKSDGQLNATFVGVFDINQEQRTGWPINIGRNVPSIHFCHTITTMVSSCVRVRVGARSRSHDGATRCCWVRIAFLGISSILTNRPVFP